MKVKMPFNAGKWTGRKRKDCPVCSATCILKLSNHLKDVHGVVGKERSNLLNTANCSQNCPDVIRMSIGRRRKDCPKCTAKNILKMSNHLTTVHGVFGKKRRKLLKAAKYSMSDSIQNADSIETIGDMLKEVFVDQETAEEKSENNIEVVTTEAEKTEAENTEAEKTEAENSDIDLLDDLIENEVEHENQVRNDYSGFEVPTNTVYIVKKKLGSITAKAIKEQKEELESESTSSMQQTNIPVDKTSDVRRSDRLSKKHPRCVILDTNLRKGFSDDEVESIRRFFDIFIQIEVTPPLEDCRECLKKWSNSCLHSTMTAKKIQDKVRKIILDKQ